MNLNTKNLKGKRKEKEKEKERKMILRFSLP